MKEERIPYEKPEVKFVELKPEERLMICAKTSGDYTCGSVYS